MATQDPPSAVRRPVDDDVRRLAKDLVRTARTGALALLDADGGAPTVGRVGLATDSDGSPVFAVSSLSGRDACMTRDARVSLLIGEIGAGDPMAHTRMTLSGTVTRCAGALRERVRRRYLGRHPTATYVDFDDFSFWRLAMASASLVRGFGRAYVLLGADLVTELSDWSARDAMEGGAVEHMNDDHVDATALYARVLCGAPDGAWRITGLDPEGIDMALGDDHRRLTYDEPLTTSTQLRPKLVGLVREARSRSGPSSSGP